ncbi:MAG TPA: hypothetical protein VIX84_19175 [Acidimicrobiales bacterium]
MALAQDTAERAPTPAGTGWLVHVAPASVVVMMTGLEKTPKPTAMHREGDTHEMPVRPSTVDGIAWGFHVRPTFVVCRAASTPTEKQSAVVGHDVDRN